MHLHSGAQLLCLKRRPARAWPACDGTCQAQRCGLHAQLGCKACLWGERSLARLLHSPCRRQQSKCSRKKHIELGEVRFLLLPAIIPLSAYPATTWPATSIL